MSTKQDGTRRWVVTDGKRFMSRTPSSSGWGWTDHRHEAKRYTDVQINEAREEARIRPDCRVVSLVFVRKPKRPR